MSHLGKRFHNNVKEMLQIAHPKDLVEKYDAHIVRVVNLLFDKKKILVLYLEK